MKILLQFRKDCHRLPRDEGLWARPSVPRLENGTGVPFVCMGYIGSPGDETHLVLECPQSQLSSEQWSHMFAGPQTMQGFMWQDDLIGVVKFVNACIIKMDPSPRGEASDQPCVAGKDVV